MISAKVHDSSYVFPAQPIYIAPDSDLFKELDESAGYVAELKKNGWRCMVRVGADKKIDLWTRRGTAIKDPLPNLREALAKLDLPADSLLDGELMEFRSEVKEKIVLWGVIKYESKWMASVPYKDIIEVVKGIVKKDTDFITRAKQVSKEKRKFFAAAMSGELGPDNEGIVLKSLSAGVPFGWKDGPTHRQWFKVKPKAAPGHTTVSK